MKNKLTIDDVKGVITQEEYVFKGTLTLCILTLKNGFFVTGESGCLDINNYDKEIGKKIAFECALNKIWELEGYLLKQRLFESATDWRQ